METKKNTISKQIEQSQKLVFNEIQVSYKRKSIGQIKSSEDAYKYLKPMYEDFVDLREVFTVLFLNRNNSIIGSYVLSTGGTTGTIVDVKILFGMALKMLAHGIMLCHNHPSGNIKPSNPDKQLTKKIKEICTIHDIMLLDHIILTSETYLSFADEGMI